MTGVKIGDIVVNVSNGVVISVITVSKAAPSWKPGHRLIGNLASADCPVFWEIHVDRYWETYTGSKVVGNIYTILENTLAETVWKDAS